MASNPFRLLKLFVYLIIFFFTWTNLGIYNLVYAATNDSKQNTVSSRQTNEKSVEEKFEKALEGIREKEAKVEDKVKKGEDTETEEAEIKKEKAEIETLDIELKKQFKETEDKIKDLSEEIKQRHRDFVKKYEENLNTLKANLDEIERAKTKAEKETAHRKTREFLEKVKPPKKHVPLDPNKLPHRIPEIKERKPRLKKEEFTEFQQPVRLAFNGEPSTLLVAQSTQDLPKPEDLAETIEVHFTDDIKAKAQELNYNPVKIYEWVRNNIDFVPTYGSIQGAQMCFMTKQCNDFDTSSLLIALLRASNIPARYVYGTIELPIDKVMNWVGGFTDEKSAVNFIASGGIPIKAYTSGGKIAKVQMEHVWVEAYVPYGPYSGRPSKLNPTKTWMPLDTSFKQYNYTQGIDLQTAVPFDAQSFLDQVKSTATINETEGSVTNVDSNYITTSLTNYQAQLQNYIDQNVPNATVGKIFGIKEIKKQELGILPASLPYRVSVTGQKYSEISDTLRHKITFELSGDFFSAGLSYTAKIPELAEKRITLSYEPATTSDQQVINSYGGIYNTPAYLVNVKPVFMIEGVPKAIGNAIGLGKSQTFNMIFTSPSFGSDIVNNELSAGGHHSIVLDISSRPPTLAIMQRANNLKQIVANGTQFFDDAVVGEILNLNGLMNFPRFDGHREKRV